MKLTYNELLAVIVGLCIAIAFILGITTISVTQNSFMMVTSRFYKLILTH